MKRKQLSQQKVRKSAANRDMSKLDIDQLERLAPINAAAADELAKRNGCSARREHEKQLIAIEEKIEKLLLTAVWTGAQLTALQEMVEWHTRSIESLRAVGL